MPFIDVRNQATGEPLPGWHDRYFASQFMSFAYYDVDAGASIHAHSHDEEEVWHIVEGTLEITIEGETVVASEGTAAVVPPNSVHSVKARTNARVIIANHPTRERIVRRFSRKSCAAVASAPSGCAPV
jgi:mannose-6-phosphate isomerase-like protein (cupin superfamily)